MSERHATKPWRKRSKRAPGPFRPRERSGPWPGPLFFKSLSKPEQEHLIAALQFELGMVERPQIRERVVSQILANIDAELAAIAAHRHWAREPSASSPQ